MFVCCAEKYSDARKLHCRCLRFLCFWCLRFCLFAFCVFASLRFASLRFARRETLFVLDAFLFARRERKNTKRLFFAVPCKHCKLLSTKAKAKLVHFCASFTLLCLCILFIVLQATIFGVLLLFVRCEFDTATKVCLSAEATLTDKRFLLLCFSALSRAEPQNWLKIQKVREIN